MSTEDRPGRPSTDHYFDRPLSSADYSGYAGQVDKLGRISPTRGELEKVLHDKPSSSARTHSSWNNLPPGAFYIREGKIFLLRAEPVKPKYVPGQNENGNRQQTLTELLEAEDCFDTGPDGLDSQTLPRHQISNANGAHIEKIKRYERPRREIRPQRTTHP